MNEESIKNDKIDFYVKSKQKLYERINEYV